MVVIIEEAAKEYILRKSKEKIISISIAERPGAIHDHGNVRVSNPKPVVHMGKTDKAVYYEQTETAGIVIYYQPALAELFGKLTINLEKMFFLKKLMAKGTV